MVVPCESSSKVTSYSVLAKFNWLHSSQLLDQKTYHILKEQRDEFLSHYIMFYYQEAQRAAEKAFNAAKVDERVNKAVAWANKSANAARVAAVKAVQKRVHHNDSGDTL